MTPKQKLFAQFYAKSSNAKQSAIAAGYSEKYSNQQGPQKLLGHAEVQAEIKRLRARLNETADKSATDVVNELSKIAFTDRVGFLKEDPYYPGEFVYKSPDELTADQRAIVEKVTYTMHEITIISDGQPEKLWMKAYTYVLSDKSKALENMGRHFGIFDDKLKLVSSQQNPFKNASPAQLEKLRTAVVGVMSEPAAIEGNYKEVKNV
jgi:phage terminase small subunit